MKFFAMSSVWFLATVVLLACLASGFSADPVAPAPAPSPNDLALLSASNKGDLESVKAALKNGASPNAKDAKTGQTPLMLAATRGYVAIVQMLIFKGAKLDLQEEKYGQTALMLAAVNGKLDVVKVLVEKGADLSVKETKFGQTAAKMAEAKGLAEIVAYLNNPKAAASGDASGGDGGGGPVVAPPSVDEQLIEAAKAGDAAKVKELLAKGADTEYKDSEGLTALAHAARKLHGEVVQILKAASGDSGSRSAPGLQPKTEPAE